MSQLEQAMSRKEHKTEKPGLPEMVSRDKTYPDKDYTSKLFLLRGPRYCSSVLIEA